MEGPAPSAYDRREEMTTTSDRGSATVALGKPEGRRGGDDGSHRSPWVGIDPQVDPVKWARLLRRAHELALSEGASPSILRELVARSWKRAAGAGMLDASETERALAEHPVSRLLPLIKSMLAEATEDARYFAVLSDADGVLLWAGGHPQALEIAVGPRFLPGHLCSERAVGTNAVGTALELDHPVQIFSAEHFNRRLHGWTCSAAPIHDPESHQILGVLDLSGSFRTGHPHSLSLVSAVARVVEDKLAQELGRRDERLRALYLERIAPGAREHSALVTSAGRVLAASPRGWLGSRVRLPEGDRLTLANGVELRAEPLPQGAGAMILRKPGRGGRNRRPRLVVRALGRRRALLEIGGERLELTPRHSEIVALLSLHPDGLTSRELGRELYGADCKAVTVRAEVSRLRRRLGPVLARNPYRLDAEVSVDREEVELVLARDLPG
jgi:GAF domain